MTERGEILYDGEYGHVCTCAFRVVLARGADGEYTEDPCRYRTTVKVDRSVEPTDSGSWWYVCERCGTGAWSGC